MEDMRYVVDLVTRIHTLEKDDKKISASFFDGTYSLWALQEYFLVGQIKEYSKERNFDTYLRLRTPRWGLVSHLWIFSFSIFVVLLTFIEIVLLFLKRPEVVVFSSDFLNADAKPNPRLRNIYNYFSEKKVRYTEIIHLTTTQSFFKNIWLRKRLSIYFEAFGTIARCIYFFRHKKDVDSYMNGINFSQFEKDERRLVELLVRQAVERVYMSSLSIQFFRRLIRFSGVTKYISVDDVRYIPELLIACERAHIPTHVFQHSNFGFLTGLYTLPSQDYIFPTTFYAWNAYWQKRIGEISPYFGHNSTRIKIGGRSFTPLQPPVVEREEPIGEKNTLKILIPYEVSLSTEYIAPYINRMLLDERITIFFVLRGTIDQIDHTMQINQYVPVEHRANPRFICIDPMDRERAIRDCDLIGGVYSGFLDESIETGVPVCVFATDFLNVNRLDIDNLATLIDIQKGDIFNQLMQAYRTSNKVLEERRLRVTHGAVDINQTLEHITQK